MIDYHEPSVTELELSVRAWRKERDEKRVVADHLAATIDADSGPPREQLNKLISRYIDTQHRVDELTRKIDRATGKLTTAGKKKKQRRRPS